MPGPDYLAHHLLLRDTARTEAYRKAIAATVRPGDTVVDIGTGSGILAVFAAMAGAKRVYAIELNPDVAELARRITRESGFGDVIEVVAGHSATFQPGHQVDVLTCDALGFFGLCDELDSMLAARQKWAPGARMVPQRLTLWLAPVQAADAIRWLDLTADHPYREMLGPTRRFAFNLPVLMELALDRWLGAACSAGEVDFSTAVTGRVHSECSFTIEREGELSGLCGWYLSMLAEDVTLGSDPARRRPMARTRFFPLDSPVEVRAGDVVRAEVAFGATISSWAVEVVRGDRTIQRSWQSSLMSNVAWDETGVGDQCPPALGVLGVFAAGDDSALNALSQGVIVSRLAPYVAGRELPPRLDYEAFARVVRAETQGGIFTGP